MSKDEDKKAKKAAKKAAAAAAAAADASSMSIDPSSSVVAVKEETTTDGGKKKSKKSKTVSTEADGMEVDVVEKDEDVEIDMSTISPIAKPLAEKKLSKKVFKTIKKASKSKGHVKRGVKEVVKGLRKGEKGLVILAGDISPMDILSHIPILCEEQNCPYIFVASKEGLGAASSTKRPTSCVMVCPDGGRLGKKKGAEMKEDYKEEFDSVEKEVRKLGEKLIMG